MERQRAVGIERRQRQVGASDEAAAGPGSERARPDLEAPPVEIGPPDRVAKGWLTEERGPLDLRHAPTRSSAGLVAVARLTAEMKRRAALEQSIQLAALRVSEPPHRVVHEHETRRPITAQERAGWLEIDAGLALLLLRAPHRRVQPHDAQLREPARG